jgi:hypothetical protein
MTGRGSMNVLHPQAAAPSVPAEVTGPNELRELVFLALLERELYIAPRGMINFSLVHELHHIERLADELLDVCAGLVV